MPDNHVCVYVHLVWSTWDRAPLVTPAVQAGLISLRTTAATASMSISRQLEWTMATRPEATAQAVAVTCSRGIHADGDPCGQAVPAIWWSLSPQAKCETQRWPGQPRQQILVMASTGTISKALHCRGISPWSGQSWTVSCCF